MTATQHWTHSETDLLAYLSGDLDAASYQRFDAHLQDCPSCRTAIADQLEQLEHEPELPPHTRHRMETEFADLLHADERPGVRTQRRPFYLLAAALAASVLLSVVILRRPAAEMDAATRELLARADRVLPESLREPLWTPVSSRSLHPLRTLGDEPGGEDFAELVAALERADAEWPNRPELRLSLAHAQLVAGDALAAEINYRDLLSHSDQANRARIGLAAALHAQDRLPEALEVLEKLPSSADEAQAALYDRALLHLELGDRERTRELAGRYREQYGDDIFWQSLELRLSKPAGR